MATVKIDWLPTAFAKKERLVSENSKLEYYFEATFEALRNGEIGLPRNRVGYEVLVDFTKYKLVLDIETDIARIKYVEITDVKE